MKIIRTGAGSITSEGVIQELIKCGVDVICADCNPDSYGLKKYGGITIPKPRVDIWQKQIDDIFEETGADFMLPACDVEVLIWGRDSRVITTNMRPETKWHEYQSFKNAGLKVPNILNGYLAYDAGISSGGKGIESRIFKETGKLVVEYISGTEYTVDVLCSTKYPGVILCGGIRQRTETAAGKSIKGTTVYDEEIWADVVSFVTEYKVTGAFCMQCIKNQRGSYWIDFNPRYGGGVNLSIRAGAPLVKNLIQELNGEDVESTGCIKNELTMYRYLTEVYECI